MVEVLKEGARVRLEAESELKQIVLASERPMLMFFWSASCVPCKDQAVIVDRLAGEAPGQFVVAMADVDDVPGIAERLAILGLPTLVLIKGGQEVQRFVGLTTYDQLKVHLIG